jgi:hypothetical protein
MSIATFATVKREGSEVKEMESLSSIGSSYGERMLAACS